MRAFFHFSSVPAFIPFQFTRRRRQWTRAVEIRNGTSQAYTDACSEIQRPVGRCLPCRIQDSEVPRTAMSVGVPDWLVGAGAYDTIDNIGIGGPTGQRCPIGPDPRSRSCPVVRSANIDLPPDTSFREQYTGQTRRPPALLVTTMRCGSVGGVPDPPYSRPARFKKQPVQ